MENMPVVNAVEGGCVIAGLNHRTGDLLNV